MRETSANLGSTEDRDEKSNSEDDFRASIARQVSTHRTRMKEHMLGTEANLHECIFVVFAGQLLAFNAGYLNGSCLSGLLAPDGLGRRQSVSAFTGAYTGSALLLAQGDIQAFGFQVCMILCFMAGNFVAGIITPKATPYQIEPTYGPTFLFGSGLLFAASSLAAIQGENEDIDNESVSPTKLVYYLVALANGIQNGMTSTYSANLIRTTHLTGTTTDIGLYSGQLVRGNPKNTWKLLVLIALAISFWSGSLVSYYATRHFTSSSLLFNAGLFLCIGLLLMAFLVHEHSISFVQAMFGTWHWKRALEHLQSNFDPGTLDDPKNMEKLFDVVDKDGSGHIGPDELIAALVAAGFHVGRRNIRVLMQHADKGGDGLISREEWGLLIQELYEE